MKSSHTSKIGRERFLSEEQASTRLRRCYDPSSVTRIFRIAVAIAVLFAVATVLVAPTIDMPETVLREHHVASHSIGNHAAGNLKVSVIPGLTHSVIQTVASYTSASPRPSSESRAKSSQVLRC
jgi:hypothetical protein